MVRDGEKNEGDAKSRVSTCCGGSSIIETVDYSKNLEMKRKRDQDNETIDARF